MLSADDDFPDNCKLFADRIAVDYPDVEHILCLVTKCVEQAAGYSVQA